jgi:hypothetical protein
LNKSFQEVKNWLISSGLFISGDEKNRGGVYSFFDEQSNDYSFLYPEITGYFISSLKFLHSVEQNDQYIKYAKYSSDWLISIYKKHNSLVQGIKNNSPTSNLSYSFDTAICAKGLLDYYELSHDEKYLLFAKKMLDDLIKIFIESDGSVIPYKNITTNIPDQDNSVWYKQKGCLHVKTAMPFFQINQYVNDTDFFKTGKLICDSISKYQNFDGSIRLHKKSKIINLHTLSYALEGLVYGYYYTKDNQYLTIIKNALNWCLEQTLDDGSIELWHNSKYHSKAAYPIAQLIRIMSLVNAIEGNKHYSRKIDDLYNFLMTLQAHHESSKINGGFYEEYYKSFFGWRKRHRINSWTSMFALQAIYWYKKTDSLNFDEQIKFLY